MLKLNRKQKLQAIIIMLAVPLIAYARITGPEPGYTNAPGDIGNCTACHDHPGQPNVGSGSAVINGVPAVYQPGEVYTLTVTVQQARRQRFGFQLTAIDGALKRAGTLAALNPDAQVIPETGFGARQYITHTEIGSLANGLNSHTWQVRWTAPDTDIGTVSFYFAGNAADNDGTNQGDDFIYTNSAASDSPTSFVTVSLLSQLSDVTLSAGSKYTITWNTSGASNIDNIEVRYTTNDGADGYPFLKQIFFTTNPAVTSCEWTVPDVSTSQARIRVKVGKKSGSAVEALSSLFTISGTGAGPPPPVIMNASISGKKLYVSGDNFGDGAEIYMCESCDSPATEGDKMKKVSNDSDTPSTLLVSKKGGKQIDPGATVKLQVMNPDGTLSGVLDYFRPLE